MQASWAKSIYAFYGEATEYVVRKLLCIRILKQQKKDGMINLIAILFLDGSGIVYDRSMIDVP